MLHPWQYGQHSLYSQRMLTIASRLDVMYRLGRAMADANRSLILLSLLESTRYQAQLARDLNLTRTNLEISSEESEEGVFAAGGLAGFGAGGISGAGSAGSPKTLELRTAGGERQTVRRVVQPVSINQSHGQLRGNRRSRRRPVRMVRPRSEERR